MTTAHTPNTSRGRPPMFALAACLLFALLGVSSPETSAQTDASSDEVIETAQTPAGELSLARRRTGEAVTIVIRLGGRVIASKEASREGDGYRGASLYGVYPRESPRYALVSLETGGLVCGARFTVVDLSSRGAARATGDFGNCGDSPRVSYLRGTLTVTFPAGPRRHDPGTHYVGPRQVWSYAGGRLRRADRRS